MTDTVSRRSALRLVGGAIAVAAAATGGLTPPSSAYAQGRPRVEGLLAKLALVPGVPRLGIPPLWVGASAGDARLRTSVEVWR